MSTLTLDAEAPVQLAREALRAARIVVRRAVRVERHADDERIGPPLVDQPGDRGEAGIALDRHGGERRGTVRERIAGGDADPAGAVVESEKGKRRDGRSWRRATAHACPASWLSMRGSMPSSDSARS